MQDASTRTEVKERSRAAAAGGVEARDLELGGVGNRRDHTVARARREPASVSRQADGR